MQTEKIDNYRSNELDEAAMRAFEEELKIDPELAREMQLEIDIDKALADEGVIDFRAKLMEAQHDYKKSQKNLGRVVHMTRRTWYAAASVIIMLLMAGSIFLLGPSPYSNEKLFKMYYKSGESVGIARSGNSMVVEAIMMYHEKDYPAAVQMFTEILAKDPSNIAIQYYAGISNIEIKNYGKAASLFNDIIAEENNLYIEYAQWYLGLSYLIDGRSEKALEIFDDIADEKGHYYQDDAKSILEKLDKNGEKGNFLNKMLFFVLPF